jgi:hypothetical protein
MKKHWIFYSLLSIGNISFGQSQEQKDSLISEMCKTILSTNNLSDSARVFGVYTKHLYPFLNKYSDNQRKDIALSIYYRFQRNCSDFSDILNRLKKPVGDWEKVTEKPKSILKNAACKEFLSHKNHSYLEDNGDTVKVQIENGYWTDHFKDGTYSKLKIHWMNDCEFDLEFIKSNNISRKGFSKPGDKFNYQILNKNDKYYSMSAWINGMNYYLKFKIYY